MRRNEQLRSRKAVYCRFVAAFLPMIVSLGTAAGDGERWMSSASGGKPIPEEDREPLRAECAPLIEKELFHGIIGQEWSKWKPYTINVNGKAVEFSRPPETESEAVDLARKILGELERMSRGSAKKKTADFGLGSINSETMKKLGIPVEDIFKPCTNLRALQTVLYDWCYVPARARYGEGEKALNAAISCYNKNPENGYNQEYVAGVYRHAKQFVRRNRSIP